MTNDLLAATASVHLVEAPFHLMGEDDVEAAACLVQPDYAIRRHLPFAEGYVSVYFGPGHVLGPNPWTTGRSDCYALLSRRAQSKPSSKN